MPASKVDRPIFVIGTPRSGTTLTAKILGKHSCLFMAGETHYFDDIYSLRNELGQPGEKDANLRIAERLYTIYDRYNEPEDQLRIEKIFQDATQLAEDIAATRDYGDVFSTFMSRQANYVHKSRWGNNAPRDIFSINEILNFYPDAKIIVCVRDVRAFLLSYKGKCKVTSDDHINRLKKLYHPVVTSYLWKASMRMLPTVKQIVPIGNMGIIKYEDLVSEPESTIKKICQVIEVDYEPMMLNVVTHNSSNQPAGSGIFTSSIDMWKIDLSPEDIIIGQNITRHELKLLNYKLTCINSSFLKRAAIWLETPIALIRALRANKDSRGPLIPYLIKRVSALVNMH